MLSLEVHHPELQDLGDTCEAWFDAWSGKGNAFPPLLVIYGNSGVGKTRSLERLRAECRARYFDGFTPKSVFSRRWPDVCDGFKDLQFGVVEDMVETYTLFLDDVGAEYERTIACKEKLCQILSRREGKFTVITTNIAPESWRKEFGERVGDRLLRRSTVVDLRNVPSFSFR